MNTEYKITAASQSEFLVTLLLDGKFDAHAIPALADSICQAKSDAKAVCLDLSEVTLVDRIAVQYLSQQAEADVRLINCPAYLRRWISQVNQDVES
jgi:anti-anti-sigma regulatory factor